jgi:hypothetical protein
MAVVLNRNESIAHIGVDNASRVGGYARRRGVRESYSRSRRIILLRSSPQAGFPAVFSRACGHNTVRPLTSARVFDPFRPVLMGGTELIVPYQYVDLIAQAVAPTLQPTNGSPVMVPYWRRNTEGDEGHDQRNRLCGPDAGVRKIQRCEDTAEARVV